MDRKEKALKYITTYFFEHREHKVKIVSFVFKINFILRITVMENVQKLVDQEKSGEELLPFFLVYNPKMVEK